MQCAGRHDQKPEMRKDDPQRSPKQQTQKLQHEQQKRKETNYART